MQFVMLGYTLQRRKPKREITSFVYLYLMILHFVRLCVAAGGAYGANVCFGLCESVFCFEAAGSSVLRGSELASWPK